MLAEQVREMHDKESKQEARHADIKRLAQQRGRKRRKIPLAVYGRELPGQDSSLLAAVKLISLPLLHPLGCWASTARSIPVMDCFFLSLSP